LAFEEGHMGSNSSLFKVLATTLLTAACAGSVQQPPVSASTAARDCAGRTVRSDSEVQTFAGCTRVLGDLTIAGTVTTLEPLRQVNAVWGTLAIDSTDQLRALDGLQALRAASDVALSDNSQLKDIRALKGLRAVRSLTITDNPLLETLSGLQGLRSLERLTIGSNGIYTLHGLGNVYSVGELVIADNPRLYDPRGLAGVLEVDLIVLRNNPRLTGHFGILPNLRQPPAAGTIAGNSLCASETSRLIATR
jgi:hypothetical protein